MRPAWPLAAAAFSLSIVLDFNGGFWSWPGLIGVLGALALLLWWLSDAHIPMFSTRLILTPWLALEFLHFAAHFIVAYDSHFPVWILPLTALILGGLSWRLFAEGDRTRGAVWNYRYGLLVGFALLSAIVIETAPSNGIDVLQYHNEAAHRLLAGQPLNGEDYHVVVDPRYNYSAPDTDYPYMPYEAELRAFSLKAFGDVRYIGVASMLATYPIVVALARQSGQRGNDPDLIASLVLVAGTPLYILQNAWTEPLAPVLLGLGLLLRRDWLALGLAFGLAASLKLWLLVMIPVAWTMDKRSGVVAVVTAGLTALPFLLQDPAGLLHGSVLYHFSVPARLDGVTMAHLWSDWPTVVGGILWALVSARLVLRAEPDPARALVLAVVGLLLLFLAGQQGHPNYWWVLPPVLLLGRALRPAVFDASKPLYGPRGLAEQPERAEANA